MTSGDALYPDPRAIDRSQHRLLVVNDDPVGRYTTVRQLNAAGFPTLEAATGAEVLNTADASLAAVVLDIHLPDIDGLEVCRRLRARPETSLLPVVHLTAAYLTDEDKVRGLDAGADAYLTHPVEPAVLVSTIQAVVRTRAAEEGMRRSEAKFRAIYAQAPSGICLLRTADGVILDANPALLKLLQRGRSEVVGQTLAKLAGNDQQLLVASYVSRLGGDSIAAEFALQDPNGRDVPLEWSAASVIEPGLCVAMATDISPRLEMAVQRQQMLDRERDARSDAERVSRMKDELIAVLSHELRTPLNAVMGWTHVLQKVATPELLARGLEAIDRNVAVQARMISDILDMSRLNIGKLPLTFERVTVGHLVETALTSMHVTLEAKGHRTQVDLEGSDAVLHADGGRLQQVLWNLLGNAAKFSPPGSVIKISSRLESGGVRISVQDQGQGIDREFLSQAFDRFTQGYTASNRQHGGLGLGLSIVKYLVEAHGGAVSAHSAGLGQGATFEFWLPLSGRPDDQPDEDAPASALGEMADVDHGGFPGLHVLVVDDDADASTLLRLVLEERRMQVITTHSYDGALDALQAHRFDLLIADIGMPGKDGYELIREVRRREIAAGAPRMPALAFTAFSRDMDRSQALAAGFDDHLPKPLRPLRLLQLIQKLITTRQGTSADAARADRQS